ncbi:hypothetical protein [Paludisphaera rhizosphaerae]|uniref:hypothetical protein n=1 Tax=Paludisphaera rhizosphaerae TaxID=2711216 RepID=UPI0013ED2AEF|nr:hypothetical protein [Paludisphaera rhizosphaerae]
MPAALSLPTPITSVGTAWLCLRLPLEAGEPLVMEACRYLGRRAGREAVADRRRVDGVAWMEANASYWKARELAHYLGHLRRQAGRMLTDSERETFADSMLEAMR